MKCFNALCEPVTLPAEFIVAKCLNGKISISIARDGQPEANVGLALSRREAQNLINELLAVLWCDIPLDTDGG